MAKKSTLLAALNAETVQPPRQVTGSEIAAMATSPADVAFKRALEAEPVSARPETITLSNGALAPAGYGIENMPPPANSSSKCTPEFTAKMLDLVREGNYPDTAAVACGLSLPSYHHWKQRGQAGEEPYATWLAAMVRACAEAEIDLMRTIKRGDDRGAGFGPAKAALEIIGRRNKRWSPNIKIEVADQLTRMIDVVERICPPEMYQKILEGIAEVDGETD